MGEKSLDRGIGESLSEERSHLKDGNKQPCKWWEYANGGNHMHKGSEVCLRNESSVGLKLGSSGGVMCQKPEEVIEGRSGRYLQAVRRSLDFILSTMISL